MKRFFALALALGLIAPIGFVGCGDEAGTKTTQETTGPGGTTTVTDQTKVETSGENPPAPGAPATAAPDTAAPK